MAEGDFPLFYNTSAFLANVACQHPKSSFLWLLWFPHELLERECRGVKAAAAVMVCSLFFDFLYRAGSEACPALGYSVELLPSGANQVGMVARLGERERVEVLVSEIYCTAA